MSKGNKPFQLKHLFSAVVCNLRGQSALKHVKMLITLTPHTRLEAGKRTTLVYWVGWLWIQSLTFSCWLNTVFKFTSRPSF